VILAKPVAIILIVVVLVGVQGFMDSPISHQVGLLCSDHFFQMPAHIPHVLLIKVVDPLYNKVLTC